MTTQKQKAENIQGLLEYFINQKEQGYQGESFLTSAKQELQELIEQNKTEV